MAKLHIACRFVVASMLISFVLARKLHSSRKLSFELHLQHPALNLHNATCMQQPLTPHLFSDQPLFHFDGTSHTRVNVGSARGLYLTDPADPAASMELRYIFFTARLQKFQGSGITKGEGGSLVLMGSLGSGAIAIVGGTGSFAFASGEAKVSLAPAGTSEQFIISFDTELQSEEKTALF